MKPKKISFGRSKVSKERKKHLASLRKCYNDTYDEITNIQEQHLDLGLKDWSQVEDYFTSLPIESLEESCQFNAQKLFTFRLKDLHKRAELSKKWDRKSKQLDKLDDAIYLAELDVVISNIQDLLKKVDGP